MIDSVSSERAAPATGRPASRAEQAAALGLSIRMLYYKLSAERCGEARHGVEPRPSDVAALPHVPIVDGPADRRWYYRTDDDTQSRLPLGLMRIAEGSTPDRREGVTSCRCRPGRLEGRVGIRHYNEKYTDPPEKRSRHKFKPKRPKPKKDLVP